MTIGQKIIQHVRLTTVEADLVYLDLNTLIIKGVWDSPTWAGELSLYYNIEETHTMIQIKAWKAVSRSYKLFISFLRKSI